MVMVIVIQEPAQSKIYSVYIKGGNTLNYLLHKNYKLYRHHIRVKIGRAHV
jgi:hypothetical protein